MYSESLDLHAASPLYQCPSLVDLDRYLLVLVYTDIRGHPCVCVSVSCVAVGLLGFACLKDSVTLPPHRRCVGGALDELIYTDSTVLNEAITIFN